LKKVECVPPSAHVVDQLPSRYELPPYRKCPFPHISLPRH
jgi:hypothetical protein